MTATNYTATEQPVCDLSELTRAVFGQLWRNRPHGCKCASLTPHEVVWPAPTYPIAPPMLHVWHPEMDHQSAHEVSWPPAVGCGEFVD